MKAFTKTGYILTGINDITKIKHSPDVAYTTTPEVISASVERFDFNTATCGIDYINAPYGRIQLIVTGYQVINEAGTLLLISGFLADDARLPGHPLEYETDEYTPVVKTDTGAKRAARFTAVVDTASGLGNLLSYYNAIGDEILLASSKSQHPVFALADSPAIPVSLRDIYPYH